MNGVIALNHKLSPIHHELDPGCTFGAWRHGIPRAHSTNSVVAPTNMQPCLPCDTNCHRPIFSAQHVRRLTRAGPAFSRSILSHGIVLDFLIVAPSHVECLDLARHRPRLTLQRIFSTLLLFGTSHAPLLALVTDSRTAL